MTKRMIRKRKNKMKEVSRFLRYSPLFDESLSLLAYHNINFLITCPDSCREVGKKISCVEGVS
jgi:hypothetical protein